MNCQVKPYEGDKPFAFFSYCHADRTAVFPIIERLDMEGFRIWYDDGLNPGDDWAQVIAEHINEAEVCIAAVSANSSKSHSCKNEMNFIVTNNKTLVTVILEDFNMPLGMKLQIGGSTYIKRYEHSSKETFYNLLLGAPNCDICRDKNKSASPEELAEWEKRWSEVKSEPNSTKKEKIDIWLSHDNLETSASSDPGKKVQSSETKNGIKEDYPEEGDGENTIIVRTVVPQNDEEPEDPTIIQKKNSFAYLIRMQTGELFCISDVETSLGRSEKHVRIVIPDDSRRISKHHADIVFHENKPYIRDNNSVNGTVHGKNKLNPKELSPLSETDYFSFVDEDFLFICAEKREIISNAKDLSMLCILIAEDTMEWKALNSEALPLDRSHKWQGGVLDSKHIHRKGEAEIHYEDGKHYLHNINSANGIYLNDAELNRGEKTALENGYKIRIAESEFLYREISIKE